MVRRASGGIRLCLRRTTLRHQFAVPTGAQKNNACGVNEIGRYKNATGRKDVSVLPAGGAGIGDVCPLGGFGRALTSDRWVISSLSFAELPQRAEMAKAAGVPTGRGKVNLDKPRAERSRQVFTRQEAAKIVGVRQ